MHRQMSATRTKKMRPELRARRSMHDLGYGYRLHVATLLRKPDIVLEKRQMAVIEVRGCFWHQHGSKGC
ncbi:MAG: hypothetical protein HGB10_04070 [Coriobacteriia bacterium]|nr:hypothetical protein [Coriobacteriia bacterium]